MKLVERSGWIALHVTANDAGRLASGPARDDSCDASLRVGDVLRTGPSQWNEWWLHPETDTALYPDQAGDLAHNPSMTLRYAQYVQRLFLDVGRNVSIRAVSCVSVNGRPSQPLFLQTDLLQHAPAYFSLSNELRGWSGVGRFLRRWQPHASTHLCNPSGQHSDEQQAVRRQVESDATYRWLYRRLLSRSEMNEWPWQGHSRLPHGPRMDTEQTCASQPPAWAVRCSFVHSTEAVWCPLDAVREQ